MNYFNSVCQNPLSFDDPSMAFDSMIDLASPNNYQTKQFIQDPTDEVCYESSDKVEVVSHTEANLNNEEQKKSHYEICSLTDDDQKCEDDQDISKNPIDFKLAELTVPLQAQN